MSEATRAATDAEASVAASAVASGPATFGIVGGGWRADFFAKLAGLLPDRLTLVGAAVLRP